MQKIIRIGFGNKPSLVGLLYKIFVPLLLSKVNGIFSGCKIQVCSLQVVCRWLPSHQRVFPSVSLLQYVPVHTPVVPMPISWLRSCFRRSENPMVLDVSFVRLQPYEGIYRTVRACKSTGAPDNTAAGVISPGSLPSMTRFGIRENCLYNTISIAMLWACGSRLRSSVVNRSMVVWLMRHHCLTRAFLCYHWGIAWCWSWRSWRIGLWCWLCGSILIVGAGCLACPSDVRRWHPLMQCYSNLK